jgi:hypothetical protein
MDHLVPDDKFSFYETTDREDMLINQPKKPRLIGMRINGETMWTSKKDTFSYHSISWAYKSALLLEGVKYA